RRVLQRPDMAPVLPPPAPLVVRERARREELREERVAPLAVGVEGRGIDRPHLLARGVAVDAREGLVALEDAPRERRAIDAREVPLEDEPVALLGRAERLLRALPVDRGRDVVRDEGEDLLVRRREARLFGVALQREHAER